MNGPRPRLLFEAKRADPPGVEDEQHVGPTTVTTFRYQSTEYCQNYSSELNPPVDARYVRAQQEEAGISIPLAKDSATRFSETR